MSAHKQIDELSKQRDEAVIALGNCVLARDEYRKMYEKALGNLRFASDKIGKQSEQIEALTALLKKAHRKMTEVCCREQRDDPEHWAVAQEIKEALKDETSGS